MDKLEKSSHHSNKDTYRLMKMSMHGLLFVSFLVLLITWLRFMNDSNVLDPLKSILYIPIVLFGVMAIINILIFSEIGPSTFMAIFIIGSVVAGPEITAMGASMAMGRADKSTTQNINDETSSSQYEGIGSTGSKQYMEGVGGLVKPNVNDINSSIDKRNKNAE